jgi:hypothetical protein
MTMPVNHADEIESASGRIALPPWPLLEALPAALDAGEDRIAAFRRASPTVTRTCASALPRTSP